MNKVQMIGRITKNIELRYTQANNTPVCSFTLAVDKKYGKEGDKTDFFNCQAWDKTAEFMAKHLDKGTRIGISGRLQNRSWQTEDGTKKYITEIIVEEVYFADSKKASDSKHTAEIYTTDDSELPF